jgi:hypothetical protein
MLRTFASLLLSSAAVCAQVPQHSLALINDPRSHGQVGDRWLSLNEAIQLSNQSLPISALSPEELAQISGFGDIAFAEIDVRVVPTLTLERDLDPILDTYHGFLLGGSFGVTIRGGRVGIVINQSRTLYGSLIESVTFEGQTECALRILLAVDGGDTRVNVARCTFRNVPTAIELQDVGRNRGGGLGADVFFSDVTVIGGSVGIDVTLGPGGRTTYTFERCLFDGTANGIRFARLTPASDRMVVLDATHVTSIGAQSGFAFEGHGAGRAVLTMRMLDLVPAVGGTALRIHPLGADTTTHLEDSRLTESVDVLGGAGPIVAIGNRLTNCALAIGTTGGMPSIVETVMSGGTTTTRGTAALEIRESVMLGGSLQAQTVGANVSDCFTTASVAGTVNVVRPRSVAHLGSMDVQPRAPRIGTNTTWSVDLPPGLSAFFVVGITDEFPQFLPRPLRFYWLPTTEIVVPVALRGQTSLPVPIPNDTTMVGLDIVVQAAVVPDPGVAAPWIAFPPGRRLRIAP